MVSATLVEHRLNDPVTQHMRTDFAPLHMNQTIGEALTALRQKPPEGRIIYFYVVDDENRLKGVVPTRRLLLNSSDKPVGDIMVRDVITLPRTATVLSLAAGLFDEASLPKRLAIGCLTAERQRRRE